MSDLSPEQTFALKQAAIVCQNYVTEIKAIRDRNPDNSDFAKVVADGERQIKEIIFQIDTVLIDHGK